MATKKKIVTKEGLKIIKEELQNLLLIERPNVIKELQEARKQGDLSENADFDAAKNKQREIEERINDLSEQIANSEVINKSQLKKIGIGTEIKFLNLEKNKIDIVKIVGGFESNPFGSVKLISYECSFAQEIIKNKGNLKKDQIIKIPTEHKTYEIKIISIKF